MPNIAMPPKTSRADEGSGMAIMLLGLQIVDVGRVLAAWDVTAGGEECEGLGWVSKTGWENKANSSP
jgi:hypothetical protein